MKCKTHHQYKGVNKPRTDCPKCWEIYNQHRQTAEDQFIKFLQKGRTYREIKKKFGQRAHKLVNREYDGYQMLQQRNNFGEMMYLLLPHQPTDLAIQDKDWTYHVGTDDNGQRQPYLLVNLPDFSDHIEIALLFDVHYGHSAHRYEKFRKYLDWIRKNDNAYAIIGGDLMENALDDGRGMSYDQVENPETQLNDMIQLLAPVAHKILVATPGNHEQRTHHKTGIDVMRVLADRLDVPYFTGPVVTSIVANEYKWLLYIYHGKGNSQTKGGKMNAASRPKVFTGAVHFLISGHVHDAVAQPETLMVENPEEARLTYMTQWTVVAPSFLGWMDTYAYRSGYPPPAKGGVSVRLYENGDYQAMLL